MSAWRITIEFNPAEKLLVEAVLPSCGCSSFLEGRLSDTGTAEEDRFVTAYTGSKEEAEDLIGAVTAELKEHERSLRSFQIEELADESWKTKWQEDWRAFVVSDRLTVAPEFEPAQQKGENKIVLRLRCSGLTFGAGTHPTTQMCLRLIDESFERRTFRTCLDFGCGTGVLGVACAALGAKDVTGIDIDEAALRESRENAELNGVAASMKFTVRQPSEFDMKFELICANILSSVLIEAWTALNERLDEDGELIVSGILAEEERAFLHKTGEPVSRMEAEEWVAYRFRKKK